MLKLFLKIPNGFIWMNVIQEFVMRHVIYKNLYSLFTFMYLICNASGWCSIHQEMWPINKRKLFINEVKLC
jgi:hypothetical protein